MFFRHLGSRSNPGRRAAWIAVVGVGIIGAWTVWFFAARVALYELSRQARLEVETASNEVDAPVAGRITANHLVLGRRVSKGELLLELDIETLAAQRRGEADKRIAIEPQIAALERELGQAGRALRGEAAVSVASLREAEARRKASASLVELKEAERVQIETLRAQQHVAEVEARRYQAEAARQGAETEALGLALGRLGREQEVRKSDRLSGIARRDLELAQLRAVQAELTARIRVLDREIALRSVRAPIDGRIGDVRDLRAGAVVAAGARLCVIVPEGRVRGVAYFAPSALGRVRAGQPARLRMDGFPWTKYGTVAARVSRVGGEPREGLVRVELVIEPSPVSRIPMEHGLPGTAEIEVERASPASLVLHTTGRWLGHASTSPPGLETAGAGP